LKKHLVLLVGFIMMMSVGLAQAYTLDSGSPKWQIMINIPEYKLYVYQDGVLLGKYPVAVGKPSEPSPIGDFYIVNKVINPVWYPQGRKPVPPGPANPLGKYWLGLNIKGYGIHGNNSPGSIGNPVSKGCFRMRNEDIEMLFRIIPKGTPVKVKYATVRGWVDAEDRAWLEIFPDIYNKANLKQSVAEVLRDLGWKYQPHDRALGELLARNCFSVMEVPRALEFVGESMKGDAFLWNNDIYIHAQNTDLQEDWIRIFDEQVLFKGYLSANLLDIIADGRYQWNLDGVANRVSLRRIFPEQDKN